MTIPTKILHSTTPGAKPASLVSGQLALNEADRILYYLDPASGQPQSLLDQVMALTASNNLIINGGMEIDQINNGGVVSNANGYAIDMVKLTKVGAQVLSTQQIIDGPPGIKMSLRVLVTTPNASPGASDYCALSFPIEGYRVQRLGWGSPGLFNIPISVGFWVKAFRTGSYALNVSNGAGNRGYSTMFTIAAASVWQWVTVTIPGDVAGTWPITNSRSLVVSVFLMAGSSLLMAPNTWTAGGLQAATGQVNGVQSVSDFMQITGMSVFPGTVSASVTRSIALLLPFAETLLLCQRYWQKSYDYEVTPQTVTQIGAHELRHQTDSSSTEFGMAVRFQTPMTADPSVTIYSPGTGTAGKMWDLINSVDITIGASVQRASQKGFTGFVTNNAANTNVDITFQWVADARM